MSHNCYKINLHAHSIFSDGRSSPVAMAHEAKALGFTALVLTDHVCNKLRADFISRLTLSILYRAVAEARRVLPVIVGLEVPIGHQEVLVFGREALLAILENGPLSIDAFLKLKDATNCTILLCHPRADYDALLPILDGYERFNFGEDMFAGLMHTETLQHLPWLVLKRKILPLAVAYEFLRGV